MKHTIFCDMDGVLCDFAGAFKKLDGKTAIQDCDHNWIQHIKRFTNLTDFFANLNWTSDGEKLYHYLKDNHSNVEILSSLGGSGNDETLEEIRRGKIKWLDKNGVSFKRNFSLSTIDKKHFIGSNNDILIDDYIDNIKDWFLMGGVGFLYTNADNVINFLNPPYRAKKGCVNEKD